jgi:FkbM family methyltransferase
VPDFGSHAQRLKRVQRIAELACTVQGRDRLRRALFWREAERYVEAVTTRDRHGNRVTVNTADPWISRSLLIDGTHDPENVDNVIRELRGRGIEPEQIVDVGANIGTSTLELLSAYPRATAVSIEPHPGNYRLLRQNVIANALEDRVRTINVAVGDCDRTVQLAVSASNPGDHRVDSAMPGPRIDVPMRRLDGLAQAGRSTLLWVDAQGYEGHIFLGAGDLLGCPALVEFWPVRLQEVGGYGAFAEAVGRYGTVLDSRAMRPAGDIDECAARLVAEHAAGLDSGYTDLLLLP